MTGNDLGLSGKIWVRLYLQSMRFEGMWALSLRRLIIAKITRQRRSHLNIFPQVYIEGFEGLSLGNNISFNRNSNLSCFGGVTIGNYVSIGHSASIISSNHRFDDRATPIQLQPVTHAPVRIGDNVWIGARVTILAGVSIAEGCVIAAGAVVTKSIEEPNSIVGGVPAKIIKSRFAAR
jgi:acetyltransferase-like isoleucine patch superfamily enzyme